MVAALYPLIKFERSSLEIICKLDVGSGEGEVSSVFEAKPALELPRYHSSKTRCSGTSPGVTLPPSPPHQQLRYL